MASDVKFPRWLPRALRPTPPRLAEARQYLGVTLGDDLDQALAVPGHLHADQAALLCHAAKICPDGPIIEIGSFKGRSAVFIARGMKPTNHLHAIDPFMGGAIGSRRDRAESQASGLDGDYGYELWETFNRSLDRLGVTERVTPIRALSQDARTDWSAPVAMVWIDGDHRYDGVRRDIEDWTPLVMPGGFAAFHDTHPAYSGHPTGCVRKAIIDSGLATGGTFETYLELRNLWMFRRSS